MAASHACFQEVEELGHAGKRGGCAGLEEEEELAPTRNLRRLARSRGRPGVEASTLLRRRVHQEADVGEFFEGVG